MNGRARRSKRGRKRGRGERAFARELDSRGRRPPCQLWRARRAPWHCWTEARGALACSACSLRVEQRREQSQEEERGRKGQRDMSDTSTSSVVPSWFQMSHSLSTAAIASKRAISESDSAVLRGGTDGPDLDVGGRAALTMLKEEWRGRNGGYGVGGRVWRRRGGWEGEFGGSVRGGGREWWLSGGGKTRTRVVECLNVEGERAESSAERTRLGSFGSLNQTRGACLAGVRIRYDNRADLPTHPHD